MHTPFKPDDASNEQLDKQIWQDPALIEALQKVDSQQKSDEHIVISPRKKNNLLIWASAAAACLIMAFIGLTQLNPPVSPKAPILVAAQQYVATEASDITLSDGTEVALNIQTSLQYKENGKTRQATLSKGEAFFSVKRDEQRLFTINTSNAIISVLGTAFNVDKTLNETIIDVFNGTVAVNTSDNSQQVELVKGQRARVTDNNIVVTTFKTTQPDWQLGWLDLENVTINDAVFQLNRYTKKPLVLNNVDTDLRVSGRFKTTDIVGAAKLIAQLNQLEINNFDDSVVLTPIEQ